MNNPRAIFPSIMSRPVRIEFPDDKCPNAKYVKTSEKDILDKADQTGVISSPKVRLYFYEGLENNE